MIRLSIAASGRRLRPRASGLARCGTGAKNGEVYAQWESISSIKDTTGKAVRYVAVFSDMSEIMRAQDKVEQLAWRDPLTVWPTVQCS